MEEKTKISTALKIRRFFALYLIISSFYGAYSEISQDGQLSEDAPGGLILASVIAFFLFRKPRNKKKFNEKNNTDTSRNVDKLNNEKKVKTFPKEYNQEKVDIPSNINDEDLVEFETQIENVEDEIKIINADVSPTYSYNPIKDNEGLFSRLFKGKNNRYG